MEIQYENLILRDYLESDIEDEIRWMNEDTAWMTADTPWEAVDPVDPVQLREEMTAMLAGRPEDAIRWRLEIQKDGKHIGFVSSYFLQENYEPMDWDAVTENSRKIRTLGIEICEPAYWGQGIGAKALVAFMDYYGSFGETRFALETWSGNIRMLRCAEKLGFAEVKRNVGVYKVDGKSYDALVLERSVLL